ncbi:apolipoprotein N-acyltransferase [Mangrovibacterium sp.]|uniref:apolipoprotein N-acyltransferase n=1 Tax=Mangrovibacterium sp. TaxID=1961364 RepID=UPI0035649338
MKPCLRHISYAVAGAFLLSLPWLGIFPAWSMLFAFLPLFILEDDLSKTRNNNPFLLFNYLFLCFWLWHLFTVWWVVKVTLSGIISLSVLNSMIMAYIWWLYHQMKVKFSTSLASIGFAAIWLAFEYCHHRWEIEWPWLCLGNGLASEHKLIQWYEYTGMLGGSLWILISNLILFAIWNKIRSKQFALAIRKGMFWFLVVAFPTWWSLNRYENYAEQGDAVEMVLLQPNIDPFTEKFSGMSAEDQVEKIILLSDSLIGPNTRFVIGPETCLPQLDEDQLINNDFIQAFLTRTNNTQLSFILGAITRKDFPIDGDRPSAARLDSIKNCWYVLYNSAILISSNQIPQVYHKSILVAGVEKMPFERYFSFLKSYSLNLGGTTGSLGADSESTIFKTTPAIGPVICFESLFGQYMSQSVKKGADVFVVITNDGWLTNQSGYRQHLDIAKIRAIETRRSIARSANTGISAFVNQRGDVITETAWWVETGIRDTITTNDTTTFYAQYGDFIGRLAAFISILLTLYFFIQSKIHKKA